MEGQGAFASGRESRSVIQPRYARRRNPVSSAGAAPKGGASAGAFRISLRVITVYGLKHAVLFIHVSQIGASQELLASMILTGNFFRGKANGIGQDLGGNHHHAVVIRK